MKDRSTWHKSSYSSDQGGNCVEIADLGIARAVRDSKNPAGSVLTVTATQWVAFTAGIKTGQFI